MNNILIDSIKKTKQYNNLIGKSKGKALLMPQYIESQKNAISEEILEYHISSFGTVQELDALCDIIVTCIGMIHICDFEYMSFLEGRSGVNCIYDLRNSLKSTSIMQLSDSCCRSINGIYSTIAYKSFYDLDHALQEVCNSNLTKSVKSKKDIQRTTDKYNDIGVTIHFNNIEGIYMPICSHDVIGADGKEYFEGKGLKGINYKEPSLEKFVK